MFSMFSWCSGGFTRGCSSSLDLFTDALSDSLCIHLPLQRLFSRASLFWGGGGHARVAGGLFRRQKKRVPEKNIGGSGGRRPVFEGVLKEKQSKNRQEGVKKTQLSRCPASNGTIGDRGSRRSRGSGRVSRCSRGIPEPRGGPRFVFYGIWPRSRFSGGSRRRGRSRVPCRGTGRKERRP